MDTFYFKFIVTGWIKMGAKTPYNSIREHVSISGLKAIAKAKVFNH